jgi:hypothetical protein
MAEAKRNEEPKLAEELRKMEYEPLLPIEKKLIAWSLIAGFCSLALLLAISRYF